MSEPRFYVQKFTGYNIPERADGRDHHERTSYYVFDRLYLHTVVATFENPLPTGHYTSRLQLLERAERECARLNAWWQEELHSDARR